MVAVGVGCNGSSVRLRMQCWSCGKACFAECTAEAKRPIHGCCILRTAPSERVSQPILLSLGDYYHLFRSSSSKLALAARLSGHGTLVQHLKTLRVSLSLYTSTPTYQSLSCGFWLASSTPWTQSIVSSCVLRS